MNICPGSSQCTEEYQVCCQPIPNLRPNYEPLLPVPIPVINDLLPR
ncbi:unnamed protein product [Onchocerca flexuosa]|uniref:CC domain-containing protein n=1 Tax=Onchocerca flexuosa TaxID=387005 RepID=A0A183HWM4_9BILA|nr:unnamed protein product [Onchocerca flexuosa]